MKNHAKIQKKIILTKKNFKIMATYYNVMLKFKGNKRFTFEKSFIARTIAERYIEKLLKDIYFQSVIEDSKITTSSQKRY